MGSEHPHVANHNQIYEGDLIMTDLTIHNFRHFLEELGKNLKDMDELFEQESIHIKNMHVLYGAMSKICENWINQLKHRQ